MTNDTRPLPLLDELAAARLKANAGRYTLAILPNGGIVPDGNRVALSPEQTGYQFRDGGVISWVPRSECRIVNAAMARDNCLDVFEELADAVNILGLLRERLHADGLLDAFRRDTAASAVEAIERAATYVRMLRDDLPADYRRDGYPVQRDEVA